MKTVPPILNTLPPPSPLYPLDKNCPTALTLGTLLHASNLRWWSISHMIIYMIQFYSLKSSHPHLLQLVQKSVLHICVSFAALHIGSSALFFQIHIYVLIWALSKLEHLHSIVCSITNVSLEKKQKIRRLWNQDEKHFITTRPFSYFPFFMVQ